MKKVILILTCFWLIVSCTDLKEVQFSEYTVKSYYTNDETLLKAVLPAYSKLRNYTWIYWNLMQVSGNETAITSLHTFDDLRIIYAHDFRSVDPQITLVWDWLYEGITECNNAIYTYEQLNLNQNQKRYIAEAKVLRAFYYYLLMDTFGSGPLITYYPMPKNQKQASRKEIFLFCEKELIDAINILPQTAAIKVPQEYGRVNRSVAYTILAKIYLNAEVYTNQSRWNDCESTCEKLISEDKSLGLTNDYFDNFKIHNENSKEIIFPIAFSSNFDLGWPNNNFYMRTLHYNQLPEGPWNGFCTTAELYDSFDSTDSRRQVLWEGQQYKELTWPQNNKTGEPLKDRPGNQLIFDKKVNAISNYEYAGIRVPKYEPDKNAPVGQAENDYAIFRFSDVLLMKAESLFRQNKKSEALELINKVRQRAMLMPLTSLALDDILLERKHELFWEGYSRQDLIRMGGFNEPNSIRTKQSESYKKLFPIPDQVLKSNPEFVQNPGY